MDHTASAPNAYRPMPGPGPTVLFWPPQNTHPTARLTIAQELELFNRYRSRTREEKAIYYLKGNFPSFDEWEGSRYVQLEHETWTWFESERLRVAAAEEAYKRVRLLGCRLSELKWQALDVLETEARLWGRKYKPDVYYNNGVWQRKR